MSEPGSIGAGTTIAREAHAQYNELSGLPSRIAGDLRRAYASHGERGYWDALVRAIRSSAGGEAPFGAPADAYMNAGDTDRALDALEIT